MFVSKEEKKLELEMDKMSNRRSVHHLPFISKPEEVGGRRRGKGDREKGRDGEGEREREDVKENERKKK